MEIYTTSQLLWWDNAMVRYLLYGMRRLNRTGSWIHDFLLSTSDALYDPDLLRCSDPRSQTEAQACLQSIHARNQCLVPMVLQKDWGRRKRVAPRQVQTWDRRGRKKLEGLHLIWPLEERMEQISVQRWSIRRGWTQRQNSRHFLQSIGRWHRGWAKHWKQMCQRVEGQRCRWSDLKPSG